MSGEFIDVNGKHLLDVKRSFSHFWNKLRNVSDVNATGDFEDIVDVDLDDECVSIETEGSQALWFRSLPYRFGDKSKVVDVFVQFKQRIHGRDGEDDVQYEIRESNISIAYVKTPSGGSDLDQAIVEQGIHFDFELQPRKHHPIFHVQYDPTTVDLGVISSRYDLRQPGGPFPDYPRVPSAPVDLPAAIYLILHDHIPGVLDERDGWPSEAKAGIKRLPTFPSECFKHHPQNGEPMVCDWWYIHGSVGDSGEPTRRVVDR